MQTDRNRALHRLQRFVAGETVRTIYKLPVAGSNLNPLREDIDMLIAAPAAEDKDIPSLLERGARGERLTTAEQSAWAGYELGWRDGRKDALASANQNASAVSVLGAPAAEGAVSQESWRTRGEHAPDCQSHIVDVRGVPDDCTCSLVAPAPAGEPVAISREEIEAARQFAAALQTWADGCVEARQWGGPTMYPEHPVSEQRARTEAHALKALLAKLGSPANSSGSLTSSKHVPDVGRMVTAEMVNAAWSAGKDRRMSGLPSDFREVLIAALVQPKGDGK